MTRILYWNIENFAMNKIANVSRKRQRGGGLMRDLASDNRRWYIRRVLNAAAPVDIVVVVEVETAYDGVGRLGRGAGTDGAIELLREIRAAYDNSWMLVPPIQTGPNESVGVFYRSTQPGSRRYFTGPYRWPGGAAAVPVAPPGAVGAYPPYLSSRLPNRVVPAGALQNVAINERNCAARVAFTIHAGHATHAGVPINFLPSRAPYMVTFAETNAAAPPVVQRNLTLFAIHSPAAGVANQYLTNLPLVEQIRTAPAPTEVRAIVGDFNVNLLRTDLSEATAYGPLRAVGYTQALRPANPLPANVNGYRGYFATHMLPQFMGTVWSTVGNPVYYPGYGYIGSLFGPNLDTIDNIYTWHGAGLVPPAPHTTILNPIARTPFQTGGGYGSGPAGTVAMPRLVDLPPPARPGYPPGTAPNYQPGWYTTFTGWVQYGYIRSTSDHLPLVIDV